jgi:hypothetical protein
LRFGVVTASPHPLAQENISLASFAIRRSFVETFSELGISFIFLSSGSSARRPLPSTGSLGTVPPLRQYYEALRLPAARPASLRFLRSAVPSPTRSFAPTHGGVAPCEAWALLAPVPVTGFFRTETTGPPRFLGHPSACAPCSLTPVGLRHLAIAVPSYCQGRTELPWLPRRSCSFEAP